MSSHNIARETEENMSSFEMRIRRAYSIRLVAIFFSPVLLIGVFMALPLLRDSESLWFALVMMLISVAFYAVPVVGFAIVWREHVWRKPDAS